MGQSGKNPNRAERRRPLQEAWKLAHGARRLEKKADPKSIHDESNVAAVVVATATQIGREIKIDIPIGVILALFPWGYQLLGFPNAPFIGAVCWALCLVLTGRVIWLLLRSFSWFSWLKWLAYVVPVVVGLLLWRPVYSRITVPAKTPSKPYDLSDREKRSLLVANLQKEWKFIDKSHGFATVGDAHYHTETIRIGCITWSDRACAAAGGFLLVFSQAGWTIDQNKIFRYDNSVPQFGVSLVGLPAPITEEQRKTLKPFQGVWQQMSPSQRDILLSMNSVGINMFSSADENLTPKTIGIYFGPEP